MQYVLNLSAIEAFDYIFLNHTTLNCVITEFKYIYTNFMVHGLLWALNVNQLLKKLSPIWPVSGHSVAWLRHNATKWKVTGLIPNFIGYFFFILSNPSHLHYGPGVDLAPNINKYQESSWGGGGKGWLACKADNLTAICEPIVQKIWEPWRLATLWAFTACYRDSFTFTFYITCITWVCISALLQINVWKALSLNLCWNAGYPERVFVVFFSLSR
jgi:hypothetical protein